MNIEIEEINHRLQWYLKDEEDNDEKEEINSFNPLDTICSVLDLLDTTKNYICQRQLKCKCKNECECDSDDYFKIDKLKSDLCSNNKYLFQLYMYKKFKLSSKEGLRVFSLNNKDEEQAIFDIKYMFRKEKGCDISHKFYYINFLQTPDIIFPIYDGIKIDKTTITFSIDFMNYENTK